MRPLFGKMNPDLILNNQDLLQTLEKEEKSCTMGLDLLTTTEIPLCTEEYNATKSRIDFKLKPINPTKWTPISDDMRLSIVTRYFADFIIHFHCNISLRVFH